MKARAIVLNAKDNVATVLAELKAGDLISIEANGRIQKIRLLSDIPVGHKLALMDLEPGAQVIKYGEAIGRSTAPIRCGEHVHVHNVTSGQAAEGGR